LKDNISNYVTAGYVDDVIDGLTKADVGLGNVDNTSDLNKPVSTVQQTALNGKTDTTVIAPTEATTTASRRYEIGEQFILNGALYTATAVIASGDSIIVDTNCDLSESITEQLKEVDAKTQHGIVELWKNNNISVSRPAFAGQSIQIQNFDANKYDSIVIAHGYSDEAEGVQWTEFTKDVLNISRTFYLDYKGWNGANGKLIDVYREISFSLSGTTLTITVSDCTRLTINTYGTTSGQTSETQNGLMVPIRILGLIHND
jgi:hypothetical protein